MSKFWNKSAEILCVKPIISWKFEFFHIFPLCMTIGYKVAISRMPCIISQYYLIFSPRSISPLSRRDSRLNELSLEDRSGISSYTCLVRAFPTLLTLFWPTLLAICVECRKEQILGRSKYWGRPVSDPGERQKTSPGQAMPGQSRQGSNSHCRKPNHIKTSDNKAQILSQIQDCYYVIQYNLNKFYKF